MKTLLLSRLPKLGLAAIGFLALQSGAFALGTAADVRAAFSALDTSRNGGISVAEWGVTTAALFKHADRNNDGRIEQDEIAGAGIAQSTFSLADENHDGRLFGVEFARARQTLHEAGDIDRDGSLNATEFELLSLLSEIGWTDRNRNGRIEPSELRMSLALAFRELDSDKDGFLSATELSYMSTNQLKRSDENRDQFVSESEFTQGYMRTLGAI